MQPTSRPPRPRLWNQRRQLADRLLGSKRPLQTLQSLQSLQSLQELQELQARSLHELRTLQRLHIDWPHVARPDFIFYTPKQIQHFIRLEAGARGRATAAPGGPREGRAPPSALAPHESPGGHSAGRPWSDWGNLASGWVAGAMLLLAALVLVRYVDRCLARKLFGVRRRQSEEWPTPTVLATSHQYPVDGDGETVPGAGEGESEGAPESGRDPPPPYTECAAPAPAPGSSSGPAGKPRAAPEEPPPPYSACYVAFSNPKHGAPAVRFLQQAERRAGGAARSRVHLDKPEGCDNASGCVAGCEPRDHTARVNIELGGEAQR